jgi:site-specific recombinase XerD
VTTATPGVAHHTPAGDLSANRASFLRALRAANLSPLTLRTYADAVDRLADYLVANDLSADVADIGRPQLEAFLADQVARWKPATAANRYRGVRRFFGWLAEEGEIEVDPTARLTPPRVPEQPPAVLSEDELHRLLARSEAGRTFVDRPSCAS